MIENRLPNERGQATRRIIRLVQGATAEERDYGLRWYQDAHDYAVALASAYEVSVETAAGVIAALSPRTSWPDNLNKATDLLATGDTWGLRMGVSKAQRIRAGEAPLDVLRGPKERAFYANIADPLGSTEVTVDSHAASAAAGQVLSERGLKLLLGPKGGYEQVADVYRSAAEYLGLAPHVVQAIVWVVWRNQNALFHYQRIGDQS